MYSAHNENFAVTYLGLRTNENAQEKNNLRIVKVLVKICSGNRTFFHMKNSTPLLRHLYMPPCQSCEYSRLS